MLTAAVKKDTSALPRLAVALPFIAEEIAGRQEAETLLQILAIEIANTGRYAVLPRLDAGQAVTRELDARGAYTQADAAALKELWLEKLSGEPGGNVFS
jgi:hypothetical protein